MKISLSAIVASMKSSLAHWEGIAEHGKGMQKRDARYRVARVRGRLSAIEAGRDKPSSHEVAGRFGKGARLEG